MLNDITIDYVKAQSASVNEVLRSLIGKLSFKELALTSEYLAYELSLMNSATVHINFEVDAKTSIIMDAIEMFKAEKRIRVFSDSTYRFFIKASELAALTTEEVDIDAANSQLAQILDQANTPVEALIHCDENMPFPLEAWPHDRGMDEYGTLHFVQTEATLADKDHAEKYRHDFTDLPPKAKVLETGPGAGKFGRQLREERPDIYLIGVAVTPLNEAYINAFDELYYALWPNGNIDKLVNEHRGTITQFVDTFAAVTYDDNPLEAVILAALMLAPGGSYSAIVSGKMGFYDESPLGYAYHRQEIVAFFKKNFNIDISFKWTAVESKVTPGKICYDLVVNFHLPLTAIPIQGSVQHWFDLAKQEVGNVTRIKSGDFGSYTNFNIAGRSYEVEGQAPALPSLPTDEIKGLEGYFLVAKFTNKMQPRMIFAFTDAACLEAFAAKFNERYVSAAQPNWQFNVDMEHRLVFIDYLDPSCVHEFVRNRFSLGPKFIPSHAPTAPAWNDLWAQIEAQLSQHLNIPGLAQTVAEKAVPTQINQIATLRLGTDHSEAAARRMERLEHYLFAGDESATYGSDYISLPPQGSSSGRTNLAV